MDERWKSRQSRSQWRFVMWEGLLYAELDNECQSADPILIKGWTYSFKMQGPAITNCTWSTGTDGIPDGSKSRFFDRKRYEIIATDLVNHYVILSSDDTIVSIYDLSCPINLSATLTSPSLGGLHWSRDTEVSMEVMNNRQTWAISAVTEPAPNGKYVSPAFSSEKLYRAMKIVDREACRQLKFI